MPQNRRTKKPRSSKSFAKRVKQVLYKASESKYYDGSATDTSLISTDARSLDGAVLTALGSIVQGDSVNERIGSSIMLKGLKINLLMTTTQSASVRMMLVSFPNREAGLDFSPLDSVGVNGLLPRQDDIEGRYKVLWDRTMNIDPDNKGSIAIKKYIRYNKKLVYKDGVSNPYINPCSLYVFTNNTTASAISVTANTRFFYKDL